MDRFGRIDVVIACAGVSGPVGVGTQNITVEQWDQVMAVNVRGNFLLAKHTVPHLLQSDAVVDTPMSRSDLGREAGFKGTNLQVMQPQQVAAHALFLASPVSAPINGTSLLADHGYLAQSAQPALEFS